MDDLVRDVAVFPWEKEGKEGKKENPPEKTLETLGEFFKVLTDPTRLKILYTLGGGELCVFDLSVSTGASVSSVSHHLAALKRGRLVKGRREGRVIFYSLDDEHVQSILKYAREHLAERGGTGEEEEEGEEGEKNESGVF